MDIAQTKARLVTLSDLVKRPLVCRHHPPSDETFSLEDGLPELGLGELGTEIGRSLQAAHAQLKLGTCPIIAVLGELNAGKSSVVASFLSEEGRKRLPRGVHSAQGTHRFVYWVPNRWLADDSIKDRFFSLLESTHGSAREFLSNDPSEAAKAYCSGFNDPANLHIPLIAPDPGLDEIGAALLDCPDVQTRDGAAPDQQPTKPRIEFLANASRLCSAFLVVWERSKVVDGLLAKILRQLRDRMADAPLYLLLNKIRPEPGQPTTTRRDPFIDQILNEFHIPDQHIYGAFDFDIVRRGGRLGWEDLTPPELVDRFDGYDDGKRLPQFFQIDKDVDINAPHAVGRDRFLLSLPEKLDAGRMQQEAISSHCKEVRKHLRDAVEKVRHEIRKRQDITERFHAGLLEFCNSLFRQSDTHEPIQVPAPEFAQALAESLRRTCPWYLRPTFELNRGLLNFARFIQKHVGRLRIVGNPMNWLRNKFLKSNQFRGQTLRSEDDLTDKVMQERWWPDDLNDRTAAKDGWTEVLCSFRNLRQEFLPDEFDKMTADYWRSLSGFQKSVKAVFSLITTAFLPAALLLAVADFGATAFAAYSIAATVSAKITAGVTFTVSLIGTSAAGAGFITGLVNLNTLPNLANFFSLACDAFGAPRKLPDKQNSVSFGKGSVFKAPLPNLETAKGRTVCRSPTLQLWLPLSEFDEICKVLDDESQWQ